MTAEDRIRRAEEAERLLKNDVLTQAFAETVAEIRARFYGQPWEEERARLAWGANAAVEELRGVLRRYVARGRAE
jgi:hypothetical protein